MKLSAAADQRGQVVLAADIGGTKIDAALASVAGEILQRRRIPTDAAAGPAQALRRLAGVFAELLPADLSLSDVVVAVACPGVVQPHHILLAPNLPGWEDVALAADVAAATSASTVLVTNDVKAGALAEARFGALRDADPGVYLNLGTGLASALTVAGAVVEGAHQAAGEIGYIRPGAAEPLAGSPSWPALEELVGGRALAARALAAAGSSEPVHDVFHSRDPVIAHLVQSALADLAAAVANLCVAVDPQRVVVGGGMMAAADVILPVLRAHLDHVVPFPPELLPATFTADAPLHGAIALAAAAAVPPPARPVAIPLTGVHA